VSCEKYVVSYVLEKVLRYLVITTMKPTISLYLPWNNCKIYVLEKVLRYLVITTMKPTISLYLPWNNCKMSLYFYLFGKVESWKQKAVSKIIQKLYYTKTFALEKSALSSIYWLAFCLLATKALS
jgi:hypothetical protein